MRSVAGFLGKTERDGTRNRNPISQFVPHLNAAFKKPAADERLIFIDLNAELTGDQKPVWIERAAKRLEQYETRELVQGEHAYVFVTNFAFHRDLHGQATVAGFPITLGIVDFGRPGMRRVSDAYRLKQKHIDAHRIGEALAAYTRFLATFDGALPSETIEGAPSRIMIGNTYCFGDSSKGGIVGTVTYASVHEEAGEAVIAVTDQEGRAHLLREPMTPRQLADYRAHKDAYFGRILPVGKCINDTFDLSEWFVETHRWMSREQFLEKLAAAPHIALCKR